MSLQLEGVVTLLQVFDMPTSLRFYRDQLGFEIVSRSQPTDECGWAWLRLGKAEIMLNTAYDDGERPTSPEPGRVRAHRDTSLYFGCPDVDGAFAFVRSRGIEAKEPETAWYGMRQLSFRDPDGYEICFQWRASEPETDSKH